jgi:hypothetical protein
MNLLPGGGVDYLFLVPPFIFCKELVYEEIEEMLIVLLTKAENCYLRKETAQGSRYAKYQNLCHLKPIVIKISSC